MIKIAICVLALMCLFGAGIFGLTAMDAYSDWVNLNCAHDAGCWQTDWREVALDGGLATACMGGAVVLYLAAYPA